MHNSTYDKVVDTVTDEVKADVSAQLQAQRDFIGHGQPFVGLTTDMTTTNNTAYITLSVSFMSSSYKFTSLMLATRSFPGTHTADEVSTSYSLGVHVALHAQRYSICVTFLNSELVA
jgi:hypothetical protein